MMNTPFRFRRFLAVCRQATALPLFSLLVVLSPKTSSTSAAEEAPVLLVPAAESTLHVSVPLPENFKRTKSSEYLLSEESVTGVQLPAQVTYTAAGKGSEGKAVGQLMASISPREGASSPRRFRLQRDENCASPAHPFTLTKIHDASVQLNENDQPRFVYNFEKITNEKVPAKDPRRSRSGYVHPLWGLHGEVLTDDFPRDHYHHHGLFWSWPHVGVGGEHYDLWMSRGIRQDFVRWHRRETGPVAAVLDAENGWFVGDKNVMAERVLLRAFRRDKNSRALDLELTFTPQDQPVTLRGAEGKSYGGLTYRLNVRNWRKAVITTPDGVAKQDLPDTPLPWADLTYPFRKDAPSGSAIFIPKDHPDYPPTWLTRHYGPLCVGWPGVNAKTFPPGKPIRLSYRIWTHAAAVTPDELKRAYADYLRGGEAHWEK